MARNRTRVPVRYSPRPCAAAARWSAYWLSELAAWLRLTAQLAAVAGFLIVLSLVPPR